jgi:hypothetical protein
LNLSEHFSLEEFVVSNTAVRAGIDNTPAPEIVANLITLAKGLELVRAALGGRPIHVTSGYRCSRLNQMVGGSVRSMHLQGLAADIICPEFGTPYDICQAIAGAHITFDQLIHEYGRWCHIGFADKPRGELLTIHTAAVGYEHGLRV